MSQKSKTDVMYSDQISKETQLVSTNGSSYKTKTAMSIKLVACKGLLGS